MIFSGLLCVFSFLLHSSSDAPDPCSSWDGGRTGVIQFCNFMMIGMEGFVLCQAFSIHRDVVSDEGR